MHLLQHLCSARLSAVLFVKKVEKNAYIPHGDTILHICATVVRLELLQPLFGKL